MVFLATSNSNVDFFPVIIYHFDLFVLFISSSKCEEKDPNHQTLQKPGNLFVSVPVVRHNRYIATSKSLTIQ